MPPLEEVERQEEIGKELLHLYRRFHFGDDLVGVEVSLEYQYLTQKIEKTEMHMQSPHPSTLCKLTNQNFRRFRGLKNYHERNLEYFDDFHPVLEVSSQVEFGTGSPGL